MNSDLATRAGNLLLQNNFTVAVAESCTGGALTDRLTDVAGSSRYVLGAVVSYAAAVKRDVLGVSADTLKNFGAISPQCAKEMAMGARKLMHASVGVSVTGNAGPVGDEDKPVGLIYIGLSVGGNTFVKEFHFAGSRREIKEATADNALNILIDCLEGDNL